ncbi:MAG: tyrosine-type recombinase/integrase [Planctomycetales bacterium]|nr:tyrosine-type recombinase/integrase [Planctomycetales bacterium]
MPRLSQSLPAYRKHRASGQAVVTLSGRDCYLGPHGSRASRREYDRLTAEWLAAGRTAPGDSTDGLTMVELIAHYWRHVKVRYVKDGRATGEQAAIKAALRFVKQLYHDTPARNFGPLALKAVRQKMVDAKLARTTINSNVHRVRRMVRWAVGEELLPLSQSHGLAAVEGLRKGRGEAREPAPVLPVDEATIDATLPHLPEMVADMVRLARLTAMRPAELCILRPCDLDREGDVWAYVPHSHKTEHHQRRRVVCLGPQAQAILLRYLARGAEDYCFQPRDSEKRRRALRHAERKTPISCGDRPGSKQAARPKRAPGDHYSTASLRRAIHRACDAAGVDRWAPNQLRHAAATAVRRQFGLEAAQCVLGHSRAAVTEVYAERDLAKAVEVARAIG